MIEAIHLVLRTLPGSFSSLQKLDAEMDDCVVSQLTSLQVRAHVQVGVGFMLKLPRGVGLLSAQGDVSTAPYSRRLRHRPPPQPLTCGPSFILVNLTLTPTQSLAQRRRVCVCAEDGGGGGPVQAPAVLHSAALAPLRLPGRLQLRVDVQVVGDSLEAALNQFASVIVEDVFALQDQLSVVRGSVCVWVGVCA